MKNILVKNIVKKNNSTTTITIKVTSEIKDKWKKFCFENNINQSKTLKNIILEILENKGV